MLNNYSKQGIGYVYNHNISYITTLFGGFLVTNWLAYEQQMLRDVGFSVFADSIQNPHN